MTIATNAAFYRKVAETLTGWGWDEFISWWPKWDTRTNKGATMPPQGVTVHHTGGAATATSYLVNPTDRPWLIVLANIHIDMLERKIRFIAAGGASHGGYTHEPCYRRVVGGTAPLDRDLVPGPDSKTFSINKRTVGIEIDGAGGADEWDEWTYRAAVATSAACHVAGQWKVSGSPRVGAHKEHTTRKPSDPEAPMGKFRRDVLDCLANPWGPPATAEVVLGSRVLSKNGNDRGADVASLAALLIAGGHNVGLPLDEFGPLMEAAVRAEQEKAGIVPTTGVVDRDTLEAIKRALTPPIDPGSPVDPEQDENGPAVDPEPEPEPEPTPEPAEGAKFRFGQVNLQLARFGGLRSGDKAKAVFLRDKMRCSLYALSEVDEDDRDAIRDLLGFKVYPINTVAVMWDPSKWEHRGRADRDFGTPYHGAVRAELVHKATGQALDVIALHVRPRAAFSSDPSAATGKQADIASALSLVRVNVPTIVAGDFNTRSTFAAFNFGLTRATPALDSLDSPGDDPIDQTWVSSHLTVRGASQVDGGRITDHKAWIANLTLPGSTL